MDTKSGTLLFCVPVNKIAAGFKDRIKYAVDATVISPLMGNQLNSKICKEMTISSSKYNPFFTKPACHGQYESKENHPVINF